MREIKFRGKRIWTDEWIYGNLVIDKHGRNHIVPFAYFDEDGHHLSYDDDTDTPVFIMQESVGQFTGLRDKNGKDIYEGDIVSYYSAMVPKGSNPIVKQVVKWKQYQWSGINNWGLSEVIGNIHEQQP